MSFSPTRRPAAGRPTFALGFLLALAIGLLAPILLSPSAASAADDDAGSVAETVQSMSGRGDRRDDRDQGADIVGSAYAITPLNLRSGPGVDFGVVLTMPAGAEVVLSGDEQDGFVGVAYGDARGWASAQFLSDAPLEASVEEPAAVAEPAVAEPAAPAAVGGDVVSIVYAAAAAYGQDGNALLAVASCESGLNPGAYNASSGASGLFQFLPGTWASTPYGGSSVFDASANANAAAWMWSMGRRGEWVC